MDKLFYILLTVMTYLVLSLVIFIMWGKYKIENRLDNNLLIGELNCLTIK